MWMILQTLLSKHWFCNLKWFNWILVVVLLVAISNCSRMRPWGIFCQSSWLHTTVVWLLKLWYWLTLIPFSLTIQLFQLLFVNLKTKAIILPKEVFFRLFKVLVYYYLWLCNKVNFQFLGMVTRQTIKDKINSWSNKEHHSINCYYYAGMNSIKMYS